MATILRDAADNQRDDKIQANNILGLNTVASPLNAPYGSTPDTLNTEYSVGGEVIKRRGTRVIAEFNTGSVDAGGEVFGFPIDTSAGYNYMAVLGQFHTTNEINIYSVAEEGAATLVMNKSNVFSGTTQNATFNYTKLDRGRFVIFTGVGAPVELWVQEYRLYLSGADFVGTFPLQGMENVSKPELLVYQDGELLDAADYGVSGDVLGTTSNLGATEYVDVVRICWGYWTEASIFWGDRFWQAVPRFRVYESDVHLAIPANLRDGTDWTWTGDGATTPTKWGFPIKFTYAPNNESPAPGAYVHTPSSPSTAFQYTFSDGTSGYIPFGGTSRQSSHITFAANHAASAPAGYVTAEDAVNVYMGRYRNPEFTANTVATDITVWNKQREDNIPHWNAALSTDEFAYTGKDLTTGFSTLSTDVYKAIGFAYPKNAQSLKAGVPSDNQISIVHSNIKTDGATTLYNVGSGAQTTYRGYADKLEPYGDGFIIPVYGLQQYCDPLRGIWPSVGVLFGNRLVLAGFADDPLRVAISAPGDSYVAGEHYTYFQADAFNDINTAPTDFVVGSSIQSDFIRAMKQFQDSIIVFTSGDVWRIRLLESGFSVQKVSDFGSVDGDAVAVGDGRLWYAASDGVFEIVQSEGLSDSYVPQEISVPIRNLFQEGLSIEYMHFDEPHNQLYAVSGRYLYVYFTEVDAWSRWQFACRPKPTGLWSVRDVGDNIRTIMAVQQEENFNFRSLLMLHSYNSTLGVYDYLDWVGLSGFTVFDPVDVVFTAPQPDTFLKHNLPTLGLTDVEDLTLTVDGSPWVFGTDWWHVNPTTVQVASLPGTSITITGRNPETGAVYDRQTYRSYWRSMKFTAGMMARYKRNTYFNGYFSLNLNGDLIAQTTTGGTVGKRPLATDVSLTFLFEDSRYGETTTDIFTVFDEDYTNDDYPMSDNVQQLDYVVVREYIQGIGTDFQAMVWSANSGTWALGGFQIDGKVKGSRHIAR